MKRQGLTLAVCTHRRYPGVERAIDSLLQQGDDVVRYRILIIDNAPAEDEDSRLALRQIASKAGNIAVISEPRLGVSHARNRALHECRTELLAFLDDDCIACPGWIQSLLTAYLASGSGVAAVGGKVTGLWESTRPPWLTKDLLGFLSLLDWGDERKEIRPPQYLVGGNILYSAPILRRTGGFKTYLGRVGDVLLSNEEIEVCESLTTQGLRLIYEPCAHVQHAIPSARLSQTWFRNRIFWQAVSDVLLSSGMSRPENGMLQKEIKPDVDLATRLRVDVPPALLPFQLRAIYNLVHMMAKPGEK